MGDSTPRAGEGASSAGRRPRESSRRRRPAEETPADGEQALQHKLDLLFRASQRTTRRPIPATEVARRMSHAGQPLSDTRLRTLRDDESRKFSLDEQKRDALAVALGGQAGDIPEGEQGRVKLRDLWGRNLVQKSVEPTYAEVSQWLAEQLQPPVHADPAYIWELRNGRKDNPSVAILTGLAAYFDVPVDYLKPRPDPQARRTAQAVHTELESLRLARENLATGINRLDQGAVALGLRAAVPGAEGIDPQVWDAMAQALLSAMQDAVGGPGPNEG
jgi:transcriptional regulator with XRE-family HTH domain